MPQVVQFPFEKLWPALEPLVSPQVVQVLGDVQVASCHAWPFALPSVAPQEQVLGVEQVAALKLWVCAGCVSGGVVAVVSGGSVAGGVVAVVAGGVVTGGVVGAVVASVVVLIVASVIATVVSGMLSSVVSIVGSVVASVIVGTVVSGVASSVVVGTVQKKRTASTMMRIVFHLPFMYLP